MNIVKLPQRLVTSTTHPFHFAKIFLPIVYSGNHVLVHNSFFKPSHLELKLIDIPAIPQIGKSLVDK